MKQPAENLAKDVTLYGCVEKVKVGSLASGAALSTERSEPYRCIQMNVSASAQNRKPPIHQYARNPCKLFLCCRIFGPVHCPHHRSAHTPTSPASSQLPVQGVGRNQKGQGAVELPFNCHTSSPHCILQQEYKQLDAQRLDGGGACNE